METLTSTRKINQTVTVAGCDHNITIHMETYQTETFSYETLRKVTNEKGNEVEGVWFWGTYGKTHIEPLKFDTRDGKEPEIYLRARWCNSSKKNSVKTLLGIIEKK